MHEAGIVKPVIQEPVIPPQKNDSGTWLLFFTILTLAVAGFLVALIFQQRKKLAVISAYLNHQRQSNESGVKTPPSRDSGDLEKNTISDMQTKIRNQDARLEKLKTENESLNAAVKEYSRTQNEYEKLFKIISQTFKVKKYPGAAEGKTDIETLVSLFETEKSFTGHVYDQFIKPLTVIVDANKNNPAGISKEQQDKLLDMLVSLSLLYIEYLYLRVNDLSVGGNMVQRMSDIKNGLKLNTELLKKLNMQNGNRALVLKLALEKISLNSLSYPVFDETDLNRH